jgi:AraC family transcriptional regulator
MGRDFSRLVHVMSMGVRQWPGMRSEYSLIPKGDEVTTTGPYQVGIAFSRHEAAVYEFAGRTVEADIPAGAAFVTGAEPITWRRIGETTEALEIYPDPALVGALAGGPVEIRPASGRDGTVLAVASLLRRAHTGGLSDLAASTLAHRLVWHLLANYSDASPDRQTGLLDRRTVDRVAGFVDTELAGTLTLDRLAAVAMLSPFHFARAFKLTTGLAPHQFVMARRIQRAAELLRETGASVPSVALAVGLSNISHFRRVFRRHTGVLPGEVRKFGPSARSGGVRTSRRGSEPVPFPQR